MKNSIVPNIQIRQEKEPTYIYNKYDNLASEDSVMYDLRNNNVQMENMFCYTHTLTKYLVLSILTRHSLPQFWRIRLLNSGIGRRWYIYYVLDPTNL